MDQLEARNAKKKVENFALQLPFNNKKDPVGRMNCPIQFFLPTWPIYCFSYLATYLPIRRSELGVV